MRIEQSGAVTKVWFDDVSTGWEQWLLLRSDAHTDSARCNRKLELKHLEEAKQRGAGICDFGDLFEVMQNKHDRRRSYDDLRPEYKRGDYFNAVIADTANRYKPYAPNFLVFTKGNHETSVTNNTNTDLTSWLVAELRKEGSQAVCGGYGGYVILYFSNSGAARSSLKIKYFHGAGAESPVTKGVIQAARQAAFLPDADIVVNGHNHQHYVLSQKRERVSNKGQLYFDTCHYIRIPGYKDDYLDGSSGWAVESGHAPKPQGAVWLRLYSDGGRVKAQPIADVE